MGTDTAPVLEKGMGIYRTVVLIDTGVRYPFYHEYAGRFKTSLAAMGTKETDRGVTLKGVDGTPEHL